MNIYVVIMLINIHAMTMMVFIASVVLIFFLSVWDEYRLVGSFFPSHQVENGKPISWQCVSSENIF